MKNPVLRASRAARTDPIRPLQRLSRRARAGDKRLLARLCAAFG